MIGSPPEKREPALLRLAIGSCEKDTQHGEAALELGPPGDQRWKQANSVLSRRADEEPGIERAADDLGRRIDHVDPPHETRTADCADPRALARDPRELGPEPSAVLADVRKE